MANEQFMPEDDADAAAGADAAPDEAEIVDAEIVGEGETADAEPAEPRPLLNQDVILAPCHHGCTCGLHIQAVYGSRVPVHDASILDHGEMGLLAEAAERAARLADEYHDYLARMRALVRQAHGRALCLLAELEIQLGRAASRNARDDLDELHASLTPAQREPAPWWLKVAAVAAAAGVAVFDAYFFQQTFLTILQIPVGAAWWKRDIGLVAALVFAVGVIAAGRIICGPVWRLTQRWRRPASPDARPPGRLAVAFRTACTVAPAAAILFVLGWWASLRGQIASQSAAAVASGRPTVALIPTALPVMMLLLSLALTVIVLEVLTYSPYQAAVRRDRRAARRLMRADRRITNALTVHDIAWHNLRSSQDEIISSIRTELARPWHTVILPARLRHGRAGPEPVPPEYGVEVQIFPAPAVREGIAGIDQVHITYQIFAGVRQPQPAPGPLAETIRSVLEYQPGELAARHREMQQRLFALLGGESGNQVGHEHAAA
jgi:hypothetical protein